jgi:hypothetical protein
MMSIMAGWISMIRARGIGLTLIITRVVVVGMVVATAVDEEKADARSEGRSGRRDGRGERKVMAVTRAVMEVNRAAMIRAGTRCRGGTQAESYGKGISTIQLNS